MSSLKLYLYKIYVSLKHYRPVSYCPSENMNIIAEFPLCFFSVSLYEMFPKKHFSTSMLATTVQMAGSYFVKRS